ncbi:hypothetical protein [Sulfuracidifex metallicus]|uniref:hypothetical protein n=1 Tax=Sulfuracidifex metallicus TaxID=47303 RepID=UPI00227572E9|nr:hypothetical protein [Sulfuracidifex metallicus]MCY0850943.1 hypothetical protein [Sulfuracidifex metallicus]
MEDLKDCLASKLSKFMGDKSGLSSLLILLSFLEYRTWGCVDLSINEIEMLLSSLRRKMISSERESFDTFMSEVKECFKKSRCEGIDHSVCIQDIRDVVQMASMNVSDSEVMKILIHGNVGSEALKFLSNSRKEKGNLATAFEVMKEDYEINHDLVERIVSQLPVIVIKPEYTLEHSTNSDRVVHFVVPTQLLQVISGGAKAKVASLEDSIVTLLTKMGFSTTSKEVEVPGQGKVRIDVVGERNAGKAKARVWVFTSSKDRECSVDQLKDVLNAVVVTRELPNQVFLVCSDAEERVQALAYQIGVQLTTKDNAVRDIFYAFLDSFPILKDIFEKVKDVSDLIDIVQI